MDSDQRARATRQLLKVARALTAQAHTLNNPDDPTPNVEAIHEALTAATKTIEAARQLSKMKSIAPPQDEGPSLFDAPTNQTQ